MPANMVRKFSTKQEKHAHDDAKRKKSLSNRYRNSQNKKLLIKNALSNSAQGNSKKIIFDDEPANETDTLNTGNENGKISLFDESDNDETQDFDIKVKSQFEGKKGQKLLNLQSRYNFDERFKLDERFQDDDDDEEDEDEGDKDDVDEEDVGEKRDDISSEKATQLKVLESVLGQSITNEEKKEKKKKKGFVEMVRFDAANEEHRRVDEVKTEETVTKKKKKEKLSKEERKKMREAAKEEMKNKTENTAVSGEKFYKVSEDLKAALKSREKDEDSGGFSLLAAFSKKKDDDEGEDVEGNDMETDDKYEDECYVDDVIKSVSEKATVQEENKVTKAMGIAKEKFFFVEDDPRFEEGLNFINMKDSDEAAKAMEGYDDTRRNLREVLRLRWQKHKQKNNPFRKKIGGSSKKGGPFNNNRRPNAKFFGTKRR